MQKELLNTNPTSIGFAPTLVKVKVVFPNVSTRISAFLLSIRAMMVWPLTSRCSWDARCTWDTCITWKRMRETDSCNGCDCMLHTWSCETVELHAVREETTQALQWLSWNASSLRKSLKKRPWQFSWAFCDLVKCLMLTAFLLLWYCFAWKGRGDQF